MRVPRPSPRRAAPALVAVAVVGTAVLTWAADEGSPERAALTTTATTTTTVLADESSPGKAGSSTGDVTTTTEQAVHADGPSARPAVDDCLDGPPDAPGTADPWGGCWPGPQNTGYPQGLAGDDRTPVTLTDYTGPSTIRSCGVVIDAMRVDGDLLIEAGNGTHSPDTPCVTITNSLVLGTIHTDNIDQGPVVIKDTEVAVSSSYWASIGFYNTFDWRVNSHGGHGTIKCAGYCESHDSWVHGMHLEGEFHYNAFGGNGIEDGHFTIEHGYADCGGFASRESPGADAGCSADIGFYGDFAPVRNITITRTYFAPAVPTGTFANSQPGYCFNSGFYPGKPYPVAENMTITNNVFARGPTGQCGVYGPVSSWEAGNGNVWSGNRWDDGTPIDP